MNSKFADLPGLGLWCNLIANLLFASSYITTKDILTEQNVLSVAFIRMVIQASVLLPFLAWKEPPSIDSARERISVCVLGLIYSGFHLSLLYSFSLMPVADASAISMTYPVLVTLLGPCVLDEKFRKLYVFNASLSVAGVFCIDRPSLIFGRSQETTRYTGVFLALSSAVLLTAIIIMSRKIRCNNACILSTVYPTIAAVTFLVPISATNNVSVPSCGKAGVYSVLSGVFYSMGTVLYFESFKLEEAGLLSIVGTAEVPFVLVLEVLALGYHPRGTSIAGVFLVLLGTIITALSKWQLSNQYVKSLCQRPRKEHLNRSGAIEQMAVYVVSYNNKPDYE